MNKETHSSKWKAKSWTRAIGILLLISLLTGCLYPAGERAENRVNPVEYLTVVQVAVDAYQERTGVLPIQNSTMDTPIYEKYKINFAALRDRGYLSQVPANAFENGGTYYYVLVDVEENPTVKLLDIVSVQRARDIQRLVKQYMNANHGQPPLLDHMVDRWYTIDYARLGEDRVQVKSVYSNQYLALLVHESGEVVIDYGPEIMKIVQQKQLEEIDPSIDLRSLLVENSYFVPAQSNTYYWKEKQPVISDVFTMN